MGALCLQPALAGDVKLQWDPSAGADLAGYKVYYGTTSHSYSAPVTIGLQTTYTVTGLFPGTYYFAVTAFNTKGVESGFSNEVSTTVAGSGVPCDINGDGLVNNADVQALASIVLGTTPGGAMYDINKNGIVDIVDVQVLVNVVLGLRSCP